MSVLSSGAWTEPDAAVLCARDPPDARRSTPAPSLLCSELQGAVSWLPAGRFARDRQRWTAVRQGGSQCFFLPRTVWRGVSGSSGASVIPGPIRDPPPPRHQLPAGSPVEVHLALGGLTSWLFLPALGWQCLPAVDNRFSLLIFPITRIAKSLHEIPSVQPSRVILIFLTNTESFGAL